MKMGEILAEIRCGKYTIKYINKLRNGWIKQGIKMSSQKMRILNMIKGQPILTEDAKMYIAKYTEE